jgi:hypothetical protein
MTPLAHAATAPLARPAPPALLDWERPLFDAGESLRHDAAARLQAAL